MRHAEEPLTDPPLADSDDVYDSVGAIHQLTDWSEYETEEEEEEYGERLRRKRPIGFGAVWPEHENTRAPA